MLHNFISNFRHITFTNLKDIKEKLLKLNCSDIVFYTNLDSNCGSYDSEILVEYLINDEKHFLIFKHSVEYDYADYNPTYKKYHTYIAYKKEFMVLNYIYIYGFDIFFPFKKNIQIKKEYSLYQINTMLYQLGIIKKISLSKIKGA